MHTTVAPTPQLRRIGVLIVVVSIVGIVLATLTPRDGRSEVSPFCLICGSLGGVDAVLNFFLYVPLGIGLGLLGVRARRALLSMFLLTAAIELAQFLSISGRDGTIGDVINNSMGAATGFAIAHYARSWLFPTHRTAMKLSLAWSVFWLLVQVISSYALLPSLPASHYYGQIARQFTRFATFEGAVLSATIDTASVPNFGFAKSAEFRRGLRLGGPVKALVIPAAPTPKIAPIVRVADNEQREIVMLGQDHRDLVFALRTGAADLRLRPLLFSFADVFPEPVGGAESSGVDTLEILGRYGRGLVEMRAAGRRASRERRLVVDPGLVWALLLPGQWRIEGTSGERVLAVLWTGLLVFPLGYWIAQGARPARQSVAPWWILGALWAIVLFSIGFVFVPHGFGLPSVSLPAWLAAFSGFAIGWLIAAANRGNPEIPGALR